MEAVLDDAALEEAVVAIAGRRARAAAGEGLRRHAAAVRRARSSPRPPRPAPEVACDFWAQFEQFERLEELRQFRPALYRRCRAGCRLRVRRTRVPRSRIRPRSRPHDHQPVGAGGASRRRDRRQRAARARHAARGGPRVGALRADHRRRPARTTSGRSRDPARAARRRHDLSLRAAVADDRGVRAARRRAGAAVSQHHAGGVLRAVRRRRCSAWRRSAAQELATLVGRVDLALGDSEFNRQELEALGFAPTGVLPIAVDTARITDAPRRPGAREDSRRRPDQHPVRRPDRAEQADRGSHPAGRALQALRRQLLPVHLRRPLRRRAALLRADPGADRRVPDAARPLLVHRPGARRGPRAPTTAGPTSTSR